MKRWEHEAILERVQKRLDDDPGKIPLRSKTVEHPVRNDQGMDGRHALQDEDDEACRDRNGVAHLLAYNMMRVTAILGVPVLVKAMTA